MTQQLRNAALAAGLLAVAGAAAAQQTGVPQAPAVEAERSVVGETLAVPDAPPTSAAEREIDESVDESLSGAEQSLEESDQIIGDTEAPGADAGTGVAETGATD